MGSKIYRASSFDSRLEDGTDETYVCEFFTLTAKEALAWIRGIVRDAYEEDLRAEENLRDLRAGEDSRAVEDKPKPYECHIDTIHLSDVPKRQLAVKCLNRSAYVEETTRETFWLGRGGRKVPAPEAGKWDL